MGFTKKELFEIEKVFDGYAASISSSFGELLFKLSHSDLSKKKKDKFINILFEETLDGFELSRGISAKSAFMRDQ